MVPKAHGTRLGQELPDDDPFFKLNLMPAALRGSSPKLCAAALALLPHHLLVVDARRIGSLPGLNLETLLRESSRSFGAPPRAHHPAEPAFSASASSLAERCFEPEALDEPPALEPHSPGDDGEEYGCLNGKAKRQPASVELTISKRHPTSGPQ